MLPVPPFGARVTKAGRFAGAPGSMTLPRIRTVGAFRSLMSMPRTSPFPAVMFVAAAGSIALG